MDRECVSLLPGVCAVLADSGSSLPDDTSLEKLLDWFTRITDDVSLLHSCPCLHSFIPTVVKDPAVDPGVLSFTLKLTGLIAATDDGFTTLQESSVLDLVFNLQHWKDAGLWEDPCLRIGWIHGLKNLLQHPKALSFFVQSDFIDPLLQLQTDSSLFVAAAANQMLAHILLFFQPASSEGCNGLDKKEEDQHPPTVTSSEYHTVVGVISEYLKESLVPNETSAQLRQSQQVLKLLALVLTQAGRPLRDQLLQKTTTSLEQLVTAGHSQLTHTLMDVILAAHSSSDPGERVSDQRVADLLSSMLNINEPSDLVHAAAAFLRRGHRDTAYTARAASILLLPFHILTEQTLLGKDVTVDKHLISMMKHLKSKTSCISLICVSLTNTPQITLMPAAVLPCPPHSIISAVLSLLRICSGISSSSSNGCSDARRNVIGSGKVQKCALEALTALSTSTGAEEKISEVFTVLIQYLDNPDSDPTVLHKSYQALVKWMSVSTDVSFITDQLRQDVGDVVRKRVCDMRWEVRDSTVEFLGHLAGVRIVPRSDGEACDACEALLGRCCATPLLKEALQDTESYVRASAIAALAKTLIGGWQQGAACTQEETEIVSRLLEILSQDTEGFARRAVVQYFISWFTSHLSSSLLMQSVSSVLSQGSADHDWEVKVHTLELTELLLDKAFPSHWHHRKNSDTTPHPYGVTAERGYTLHTHISTHTRGVVADLSGPLNDLVEKGVVSALLSGLVDCDRPVALKACRLLITLRETICPLSLGAQDAALATVARVSCELPDRGWGEEIKKILEMKKSDGTRERSLNGGDEGVCEGGSDDNDGGDGGVVVVGVCDVLKSLGLDERLEILSQSSDHVHNSPLSLLQDILTARDAHSHTDTETGEGVIVDCY